MTNQIIYMGSKIKWNVSIAFIQVFFSSMILLSCSGTKGNKDISKQRIPSDPCTGIPKDNPAVIPLPKPRELWMTRHNLVLEQNKRGRVDLIFIGNSLTQRWESNGKTVWEHYFGNLNAVNMGFDGDVTENVLWRLDNGEIDGISPKVAVVLIGSNHVRGYKKEDISDGIRAICCRIRAKLPKTKILLLGILPRGDASAADAYRLNKASELASSMADNRMIYYLNFSDKFLDGDGNVSRIFMVADGVHLTEAGYEKLAQAIAPSISKLMGKR